MDVHKVNGQRTPRLSPMGRIQKPEIALVCQWIVDAWKEIPDNMVRKSCKKWCISNRLDGVEDDIWDNDNASVHGSAADSSNE